MVTGLERRRGDRERWRRAGMERRERRWRRRGRGRDAASFDHLNVDLTTLRSNRADFTA